jgi:hypothetical protein
MAIRFIGTCDVWAIVQNLAIYDNFHLHIQRYSVYTLTGKHNVKIGK